MVGVGCLQAAQGLLSKRRCAVSKGPAGFMAPPAVSLGRDGKLDVTGLGRVVGLVIAPRRAHRRRKPARLLDQPLGLARHVGLLQMVDPTGRASRWENVCQYV